MSGLHPFSLGPICLPALADVVALLNDDRSEKIEHKTQAGVNEEVFHALFPVSVADLLEELMQDWIRRPPLLRLLAQPFKFLIIIEASIIFCMIDDHIKIMIFE